VPAGVVRWNATINNTTVDLIDIGSVQYEIWTPGQFQFTVPNDSKHRSILLGSDGYAGAGKEVKLYREVNNGPSTLMMKGPVYNVRVDNNTIQVGGRGKGIELARSYTGDNEYFLDYPATKIISHILHGTDFTLGETSANPPDISCRFYTENKWRALMDTVKNFTGWEARVETDDTITFKEEVGTDRSASFVMRYGYNVVSDGAREINYEDLVTRVIVRGEGEGFNQIKASVIDTTVESQFWPRVQVYDDRSIDNIALAQNVAQSRLSAAASPRDQITLQTTDMFDPTWTLELGDTVAVDWPQLALNQDMRIRRLQYQWGMQGERIIMDLNKERRSLARAMAGTNPGIRQAVETEARHPQGATNIWQLSKTDNCDTSHPLVISFYLPSEIQKINKAKFNIRTFPIRYYTRVRGIGRFKKFYQFANERFPHNTEYTSISIYRAGVDEWPAANNLLQPQIYGYKMPLEGTAGMIYDIGLRPKSWVDVSRVQFLLKNPDRGGAEYYANDCDLIGDMINTDGHENWHRFYLFVPRVWDAPNQNSGADMFGEFFSFIMTTDQEESWTSWEYYIRPIRIDLEMSSTSLRSSTDIGIWEKSYDQLSVTAYIKKGTDAYTQVWQGSIADSGELSASDITFADYVSAGTWHKLKFEVSDNCNAEAEVYIEAYIQSR